MNFAAYCRLVSEITRIPEAVIKEETSFRNDLGIDSLRMVNLYVELAERTGVPFEIFTYTEDMDTAGGVYRALRKGAGPA